MTIVFFTISLLILCYILAKSTDILVRGIEQLAEGTKLESYGITTLIVALATSLPELFVSVAGALEGSGDLPLGTIIGSNIVNMSLVLGLGALISGSIKAKDSFLSKDVMQTFLVAMLPLLLLLDTKLSRLDGLILIGVYLVFSIYNLPKSKNHPLKQAEAQYYQESGIRHRILELVGRKDVEQGMLRLVVGSALLIVSAHFIVKLSTLIATALNAPVLLVGLFMVSVGTSLPELAFEIKTIAKREYMMAFGNIIGSTVVNSSLILGLASAISPFSIGANQTMYYLSVIGYIVVFFAFWGLTWTRKTLDRFEGAILVMLFFAFLMVQLYVQCQGISLRCSP